MTVAAPLRRARPAEAQRGSALPPLSAPAPGGTSSTLDGLSAHDRWWRLIMVLWAVMLGGYALFDKGFAYLHIPGTPMFIGELCLVPIVVLIAVDTRFFAGHRLVPLAALGAYCGWAALRLVQSLSAYRLDAIRDSAMWYYATVAVLVVAWFGRFGPSRAFAATVRFVEITIIAVLVWSPVAVMAERVAGQTAGPVLPFTGIPVLTHKPSNLAPLLALAMLYAWHYPSRRFGPKARLAMFTVALVELALVGTQTRGGFVAGVVGVVIGTLVVPRRVRLDRIAKRGVSICLVIFVVAFALDLKVPAGRELSVRQLTNNMLSLVGKQSEDRQDPVRGSLEGNAQWREQLWSSILDKTFSTNREITGWGFGPNLGDEIGFENQLGDGSLRSPHNSHLSVFARLGAIGFAAWLLLWATWGHALVRLARRRQTAGTTLSMAAAIAVGTVAALHVNAYFDPAYESPQAGAWMWATFGAGCGLLLMKREVLPPLSVAALASRGERWTDRRPRRSGTAGRPSERGEQPAMEQPAMDPPAVGVSVGTSSRARWARRVVNPRWIALTGLAAGLALAIIGTATNYDTEATGDRSATAALSDYRDAIYQPVRALAEGVNPYDHEAYLAEMAVDQELPPYFPINYVPFAPLAALPLPVAAASFFVLSVGAVLAAALLIARNVHTGDRFTVFAAVSAAVLLSRPGFQALQYGQAVPWVMLATVGLIVGMKHRRPWLIGLAVAVAWAKPSLGLPLACLLALHGHRRAVLWGTVGAGLSWVPVGLLLLRHDGPVSLVRILIDDLRFSAGHPFGALLGLTRVDLPAVIAKLAYVELSSGVQLAIGLSVLAVSAVAVRRDAEPAKIVLIIVLGSVIALWRQPYDLVLVAAPLAWLVFDRSASSAAQRRRDRWIALSFAPAALSFGFGHQGASLLGLQGAAAARLAALTGLSAALCWGLCAWDATRSRPATLDEPGPTTQATAT